MQLRFFDFEVFPNWWLCVFGDMPENEEFDESIKDTFKYVTSDDKNSRDALMSLMKEPNMVQTGYNIKRYDLTIANAIYQGFTPQQVSIVNELILDPDKEFSSKEHQRMAPFAKKRLNTVYLDLYDSSTGSLKDKEAILGLNVKESMIPFDKKDLTEEDKKEVIKYCFQDVYASMKWYDSIVKPFVKTKLILCKTFNIEEKYGYICTNAGLVSKALKVKKSYFADENKIDIQLPESIKAYCERWLPKEVLDHVLHKTDTFKVKLFDNKIVFADGGIHSELDTDAFKLTKDDSPVLYVTSDDEYVLLNVDAESYYPSMMIHFKTLSRSITEPELFKNILEERFRIKHKKNKTKEDDDIQKADKLILNTTYGASGSKWLDLYDPYQRTRTCRFGQLFLIALACKLTSTIESLKVIQTNTDGILVYCKRSDIPKVDTCMNEWHDISGIGMEKDFVDAIWQKNVNNYAMIKEGGSLKIKGAWLNHTIIRPGYIIISPRTAFISGRACCEYLVHGKDIVKTIVECKDLMDFAITTTKGPTFKEVVYRYANGMEIPTYNYNRLIASKDKKLGQVYKVKYVNGRKSYTVASDTPEHSLLLNEDISTYNFDDYKSQIDYMYYIERCANQLSGSWVQLVEGELFRTNQFNYFENQNSIE